jgi:hypothetical protein
MSEMKEIIYLPIDVLHFDPQNPRLPSSVDDKNEESVMKWMVMDGTILELMMSIGEKGYFPGEALLVVSKEGIDGHYWVIEGNRRLAATKLLCHPELAPVRKKTIEQASSEATYRPESIPVLIFPRREDIIYYLGYRHITGIKTWGALAKAKYLNQLLATVKEGTPIKQYQVLAKIIGSRADYVARTLAGLDIFEKIVDENFFGIKGLNEDQIDFAVLTTGLNYQNIYKYIGMESAQDRELKSLNLDFLKELTSWMFEKVSEGRTRLGESRNLGDLNSVLGNEKARDAFKNGIPLSDAVLLTDVPSKVFQKALVEAKSRLQLARDSLHLVNEFSSSDSDVLSEIQQIAKNIRTVVDEKLINGNDL